MTITIYTVQCLYFCISNKPFCCTKLLQSTKQFTGSILLALTGVMETKHRKQILAHQ